MPKFWGPEMSIQTPAEFFARPMPKSLYQLTNEAALIHKLPQSWYPNCKCYGDNLRIGNINGDAGESLSVSLETGAWMDHASGESGGDLISLYAAKKNINQVEALKKIQEMLKGAPYAEPSQITKQDNLEDNIAKALTIWSQGQNIFLSLAMSYLIKRNLNQGKFFHDLDASLKYHSTCPCKLGTHRAMIALITDIETGVPCGVHRTFINADGSKADFKPNKMMLGRATNAVVRLSKDEEITNRLGIAEGLENGLTILGIDWGPIWVALSANGIKNFPVLPKIQELTIFADNDNTGVKAAEACAQRWVLAGKKVIIRTPKSAGKDWNNVLMEVLP